VAYPIFPSLAGLGLTAKRTPVWSSSVQKTQSGKKTFLSYMSYPLYQWSLDFTALRSYTGYGELAQMIAFVNNVRGMAGQFLYMDPEDNTATAQGFGTGDGTTVNFQLVRQYGGYAEPVQNPLNPQVFRNQDWQGNQLLYATPRANYCKASGDFTNAFWNKLNVTIASNVAVAPDGTATMDGIIETTAANANHDINCAATMPIGDGASTCSFFVMPGARTFIQAEFVSDVGSSGRRVIVNLSTGAVTSQISIGTGTATGTATVVPQGGGVYLVTITMTPGTTGNAQRKLFLFLHNGTSNTYTGDGTSGLYAWGVQIEAGSVRTPLISTSGANVTVTDYSIGSTGVVTFPAAPLAGAALTWSGQFYFLCNFLQDNPEFDQEHINIWSLSDFKFESIKL
jgi:hypothetical protein